MTAVPRLVRTRHDFLPVVVLACLVVSLSVAPTASSAATTTPTPASYRYDSAASLVHTASVSAPRTATLLAAVRLAGDAGGSLAAKDLSQRAKRRLAKEYGDVARSATPVAQGGSAKTGRWWEYKDTNGTTKIVVEHPDGSVHVGVPKPQSTHRSGGPPKYYDYGRFGHIGEK